MCPKNINRRKFLKLSSAATAGASIPWSIPNNELNSKFKELSARGNGWTPRDLTKKPNILVVVLDDVGFGDLGCYGAEHSTPAMDSVAKDGTTI